VALELLQSLKGPYPHLLQARYKLDPSLDIAQAHEDTLLEAIGRKRGAVIGGNRVNTTKAAEVVLNDFRQNLLGCVTLETPEQFAQWQAEADAREAALQKVREEKAKGRKRSFRGGRESWEQPARAQKAPTVKTAQTVQTVQTVQTATRPDQPSPSLKACTELTSRCDWPFRLSAAAADCSTSAAFCCVTSSSWPTACDT
jgi:hypothetical protein